MIKVTILIDSESDKEHDKILSEVDFKDGLSEYCYNWLTGDDGEVSQITVESVYEDDEV